VVDILATGGIDALERPYDLTGTYTVAEWFWEMLPTDAGPDLLETTFDWTHSGQGSDHPGRSVRLPAGDVSFEDEDESELGVLKGMLRFWLCDLFQVGGAWRLRHRASTGDVLSYNGTGYQSGTSYSEASVGDSDFLRKVNSTRKEIKRISVAGLGGATSKRLLNPSGFQNTSFSDWNEDYSRPIGWEIDGSVSHQTTGDVDLVRISSTVDSLIQSIERSYSSKSTIHIELEYKIPSNASTGDYTMHLASCRLEGTADGSARYVKNDGSLTASFSYLSKEVTITNSNQGSVQSATFDITIDPSAAEAGAPEVELTHAVPSGQRQTLEWVQYSTVEWTTTRAGPQAAVYEGAGDGQQSTSLATPLGDRTFWHARGGIIEIYNGTIWVPATEAWEQAGDTHAIHRARLYALLAERRREIHGLDASYDRDRFALANPLLYESDTHLLTQTDFRLGRGGQRLAGRPRIIQQQSPDKRGGRTVVRTNT